MASPNTLELRRFSDGIAARALARRVVRQSRAKSDTYVTPAGKKHSAVGRRQRRALARKVRRLAKAAPKRAMKDQVGPPDEAAPAEKAP